MYRVKPSIWMGAILAFVVFFGSMAASAAVPKAWQPVVGIPTAVILVLLVGAITGWRLPLFFEPSRERGALPQLLALGPFMYVVYCGISTNWSAIDSKTVLAALLFGVWAGVGEELAFRGALLVGIRGKLREVWVATISAIGFGLLHGINFFSTPSVETAYQIVYATAIGFGLYAMRRVTGSIFLGMVFHAMNNFLDVTAEESGGVTASFAGGLNLPGSLFWLGILLGIASAIIVIRRTPNISLYAPAVINDRTLA